MILFAKAPVAGRVKTRLAVEIGAARAAALYRAFVADSLAKLNEFTNLADLQLHTDIPTDAWSEVGVAREVQTPGDLHVKLLHALAGTGGGPAASPHFRQRLPDASPSARGPVA